MGQLIKLQDYVSRYELDIYKYPSRFIRLKRLQWQQLYKAWDEGVLVNSSPEIISTATEEPSGKEKIWGKMKSVFTKNKEEWQEDAAGQVKEWTIIDDEDANMNRFPFQFETMPKTVDELKYQFLEEIFKVQIQWASSTVFEQSNVDISYFWEKNLKYFMLRFPDTFLFLYKPVFSLKKAEIQTETILLTPLEVVCIKFIESEDQAVYIGSEDHFWEKRVNHKRKKFLNPLIALNRTESIIKGIWKQANIDFPISKVLISRNGFIDFPSAPYGITLVDHRNYPEWFERMREFKAPMKNGQLKAARALLIHCHSVSKSRIY